MHRPRIALNKLSYVMQGLDQGSKNCNVEGAACCHNRSSISLHAQIAEMSEITSNQAQWGILYQAHNLSSCPRSANTTLHESWSSYVILCKGVGALQRHSTSTYYLVLIGWLRPDCMELLYMTFMKFLRSCNENRIHILAQISYVAK